MGGKAQAGTLTGIVSVQGRRAEMQDRYVLVEGAGGLFGGVYDGHGGEEAAEQAAAALHAWFFEALVRGLDPETAFAEAFRRADRAVQSSTCGTTATAFFVQGGRLTVANLGDGRVILVGPRGAEVLTRDHRVDDPEERARIVGAGGRIESPYVMRGDHGLMLARSLGDKWFGPVGVIATPEIASRALGAADLHLVAACDGLWDVLDSDEAAALVRAAAHPQAAAAALAEAVSSRGGRDNLTILVVRLVAAPA